MGCHRNQIGVEHEPGIRHRRQPSVSCAGGGCGEELPPCDKGTKTLGSRPSAPAASAESLDANAEAPGCEAGADTLARAQPALAEPGSAVSCSATGDARLPSAPRPAMAVAQDSARLASEQLAAVPAHAVPAEALDGGLLGTAASAQPPRWPSHAPDGHGARGDSHTAPEVRRLLMTSVLLQSEGLAANCHGCFIAQASVVHLTVKTCHYASSTVCECTSLCCTWFAAASAPAGLLNTRGLTACCAMSYLCIMQGTMQRELALAAAVPVGAEASLRVRTLPTTVPATVLPAVPDPPAAQTGARAAGGAREAPSQPVDWLVAEDRAARGVSAAFVGAPGVEVHDQPQEDWLVAEDRAAREVVQQRCSSNKSVT